jgi:hypothetical protein
MIREGKTPLNRHSSADRWRHEDLSTLLQTINNIYESRVERQESFEDFVPTVHRASADSSESDLHSFNGSSSFPPLSVLYLASSLCPHSVCRSPQRRTRARAC